ncbi:MAG: TOBE domain-containing protein [Coriobacteriia bacterium]|nr:TOBE domain-containing protein [Coriobacteriia bacterium]
MLISARNQIKGKVEKVVDGAVNSRVVLDADGVKISATITDAAVAELGLEAGKAATAIIKSTSVMVKKGGVVDGLSARNQIAGTVDAVEEGAVSAVVKIKAAFGIISANITLDAAKELGLAAGDEVVAIVKSTDVMVAA